jgi:hypothetical protein
MHMTLVPESAKQAPATNPTYPEPTTAIFTPPLVARLRAIVDHFVGLPRQLLAKNRRRYGGSDVVRRYRPGVERVARRFPQAMLLGSQ